MVKHIVFWRMHEFAEGNDKETNIRLAVERIDQVVPLFPKLRKITHNRGLFSGAHYWDFVEEMEFDDIDALKEWAAFPPHVELHNFVEKIRIERAAVDYEF